MAFNIRQYLGVLQGGNPTIKHDNVANPLPDELLDRLDRDINDLIVRVTGGRNPKTGKAPTSKEDFQKLIQDVLNSSELGELYPPNDPRINALAAKAAELLTDPTYPINDGHDIADVVRVCLYDIVLYCDDSLSMTQESRIATQVTFAQRFARLILPMQNCSISLRFINASHFGKPWDKMTDANAIAAAVQSVPYTGYTQIGAGLKNKILEPMLYQKLDSGTLTAPLCVIIVTDGWPYNEANDYMRNVMEESIQRVAAKRPKAKNTLVKYQINQIGHEAQATAFLQGLHNDQKIASNVYCTSEILDDKISELKDQGDKLDKWLVELLSTAPTSGKGKRPKKP